MRSQSATYSYVANSPLVGQIVHKQSGSPVMTTTKSFDLINRLTSISSTAAGSAVASSAYQYNSGNQRVRNTLANGSYWIYEYDPLGQVRAGRKFWADGTPVAGQQFEYTHDDIGNRRSAKAGGDQNGVNLRSASYTPNNLNQYTSRTVPGAADVMGVAIASNGVTVAGLTAYRKGEYFRKEVPVNNTSAAVWTNLVVSTAGQNPVSGNMFVPQTPEAFVHDFDGNLTSDGRFNYTWDAENRLLKVESLATNPTASKRRVTWEFDAKGRRVRQTTYDGSSGSYVLTEDLKFISDGWRHIAALNAGNNSLVHSYLWGLDLTGSFDGADGVGGLLAVSSAANGAHFTCYDGNGNIAALLNAATSARSAVYEYGPFGEPVRLTGSVAKENPFRFSTKRASDVTDTFDYGFRTYAPAVGFWISSDPRTDPGFGILTSEPRPVGLQDPHFSDREQPGEEREAETVARYFFVHNDAVNNIDPLGLWQLRCRPLAGLGKLSGQRHCWVECRGHSYSLQNNSGNAVKVVDDPRDKGKGTIVAQGSGKCACIAAQFRANNDSFQYKAGQCNSNYYAHKLLECCGIFVSRPPRAYGWDDCDDAARQVSCVCWSGM
jgi:RHS repeat-associated protein